MPARAAGQAARGHGRRAARAPRRCRRRSPARHCSTGPSARPTPPMPPEPGVAGEIIAAGQRHRRRRRQPGAQAASARPRASPSGAPSCLDRDPHPRRQLGVGRRQRQPQIALGDRVSTRSTLASELGDQRPLEPRRRDPGRARPDQARSRASAPARTSPPRARPARRAAGSRPAPAPPNARNATQWLGSSSANQAAMPAPKPTTNHGGSCPRSRSRKASTRSRTALKRASQNRRARCGRGAPAMLGALIHCMACTRQRKARLSASRQ